MNFLFYIFLASTDTVQYYYLLFDRLRAFINYFFIVQKKHSTYLFWAHYQLAKYDVLLLLLCFFSLRLKL